MQSEWTFFFCLLMKINIRHCESTQECAQHCVLYVEPLQSAAAVWKQLFWLSSLPSRWDSYALPGWISALVKESGGIKSGHASLAETKSPFPGYVCEHACVHAPAHTHICVCIFVCIYSYILVKCGFSFSSCGSIHTILIQLCLCTSAYGENYHYWNSYE